MGPTTRVRGCTDRGRVTCPIWRHLPPITVRDRPTEQQQMGCGGGGSQCSRGLSSERLHWFSGPLGLVVGTAGVSGAGKPIIEAGSGSSISCSITASVKLTPPLKNDWVAAAHASDPDPAVVDLPDTTFASNGPELVLLKGTGTCTGTVTDGVNTASVTGIKFELGNDPGHLGNSSEATCLSLVTGIPPSTAEYDTLIQYTSPTAKIFPTTVTDETIPPASFSTEGGVITGSFAGGSSSSVGVPDSTTIGAITQGAPTSTDPVPAYPQCQPSLKLKTGKTGPEATLKAPKGLKKISLVTGSSLSISR